MLRLLIKKELLNQIQSPRFTISFLLVFLLIVFSGWSFMEDYRLRRQDFHTDVAENDAFLMKAASSLSQVAFLKQNLYRPPSLLEYFAAGNNQYLPNSFQSDVFKIDFPNLKSRHNPLQKKPLSFDFSFLVTYVFTFLALILTYDAVCREKNEGTLSLQMSNPLPRAHFIISKFVVNFLLLGSGLIGGLLLNLVLFSLWGESPFSEGNTGRIMLFCLLSLLLIAVFLSLGLLVSTLVSRSETSMVILLLLWTLVVVVIPSLGRVVADLTARVPTKGEIEIRYRQAHEEVWNNVPSDIPPELNPRRWTGDPWAPNVPNRSKMINSITERQAKIFDDYIQQLRLQVRRAQRIIMASPTMFYRMASEEVVGTGLSQFEHFYQSLKHYEESLRDFILRKDASDTKSPHLLNAWHRNTISRLPVDFNTIPRFQLAPLSLKARLPTIVRSCGVLLFLTVLLFLVTYVAFIRYDVR